MTSALHCAHVNGHTLALETLTEPVAFRHGCTGAFNTTLQCSLLPDAGTAASLSQYCVQPRYDGVGLVAFTDGSFTEGSTGQCRSGYAVVLCKLSDVLDPHFNFADDKCVVLTGTAPVSGANYTAEMQALLIALHAVPVNVPLLVGSDALSAIQVLRERWVSYGSGPGPWRCLREISCGFGPNTSAHPPGETSSRTPTGWG